MKKSDQNRHFSNMISHNCIMIAILSISQRWQLCFHFRFMKGIRAQSSEQAFTSHGKQWKAALKPNTKLSHKYRIHSVSFLLSNMWCSARWEQLEVKSGCFSCLPSHLVSRLSLSQSLKVNKKSLNIHRQWAPCSSQAGSTDGQHLGLI